MTSPVIPPSPSREEYARDYAAVQGCVLLIAFVSAILNLIVDIIYTFIDPRMKTMYESSKGGLFRIKKKGEQKIA